MENPEHVTRLARVPDSVKLTGETEIAFTPRELKMVREATGRSWSQIMSDEEDDEKFAVLAWLRLRREGHQIDYAQMEDVIIRIQADEDLDPTKSGRSKS